MERPLLFSLFFISLALCFDKSQSTHIDTLIVKSTDTISRPQTKIYTDSVVTLFDDDSYKLTLHIFDTTNDYDAERNNVVLTFSKLNGNQRKIFFQDTMFCMHPGIGFQDFNNDKAQDVLVFYYTGARANPTYHLYLTDLKNYNLIRVKGFEKLPNPDLDTTNNIITSIALSGNNYYSFYRITKENKLINLGHGYEDNANDSTQYERTVRQILNEHK
ncbi:MAG: hypothetical protein JST09_11335 [Bacteroidetes bacterium]|nr:hypothetical protein [Bacteroidota bacterium]MBS1609814.1 hypothetical protein [Bacteroidota bacterium]